MNVFKDFKYPSQKLPHIHELNSSPRGSSKAAGGCLWSSAAMVSVGRGRIVLHSEYH